MISANYLFRNPLSKEGEKKPRVKEPKISACMILCVLQPKYQHIVLKKQLPKKNTEEVSEYANLLVKRMKNAKEKHQRQIARN